MLKPRNTLVLTKLIVKAERQVGKITVPTNKDCYCEAEVIAVGPGGVSADGGRSETFDLKPGQRVWVKHKEIRNPTYPPIECGIVHRDGDETYHLFEQTSVLGILAEPGEFVPTELSDAVVGNAPAKSTIIHA